MSLNRVLDLLTSLKLVLSSIDLHFGLILKIKLYIKI
jgi:hypothetical protein